MKPVTGYLAEDNTFFHKEVEARKHDAEMEIRGYCFLNNLNADKLLSFVEALADPIMEFVNASIEIRDNGNESRSDSSDSRNPVNPPDDSGGAKLLASAFELPVDGHEPVSDVGGSTQSTELLDERTSDGSGSWRDDAPSVRSGAHLSTSTRPKAPKAR